MKSSGNMDGINNDCKALRDKRITDEAPLFQTIIEPLRSVHELANDTIINWNMRGASIKETVARPKPQVHRRGLLNVFGDLSKAVFGTATDAHVPEVKLQLRDFGNLNHKVVHSVSVLC